MYLAPLRYVFLIHQYWRSSRLISSHHHSIHTMYYPFDVIVIVIVIVTQGHIGELTVRSRQMKAQYVLPVTNILLVFAHYSFCVALGSPGGCAISYALQPGDYRRAHDYGVRQHEERNPVACSCICYLSPDIDTVARGILAWPLSPGQLISGLTSPDYAASVHCSRKLCEAFPHSH
ncbi:hypothetical protein HD806DRAFT_276734 [Xylariaceae sp. AK1471]|nr:hypothetical protein HD806DRAFT_276734 [Xylariaceae sp. AK1471]